MNKPYVNYSNRDFHRFSILYADDGFGNLVKTHESIYAIVFFINGGFGINGL